MPGNLTGSPRGIDVDNFSPAPGAASDTGRDSGLSDVVGSDGVLVLIDLDGTLVDSGPGVIGSLRPAFVDAGVPVPSDAALHRFLGPPIHYSLAEIGITGDTADRVVAAYRQHYHDVGMHQSPAFPGIADALTQVRATLQASHGHPVRLAVATSKPEKYAIPIVHAAGLDPHLDAVYGASIDGTRTSKADVIARGLTLEAAHHEATATTSPGTRIMIGDRKFDVTGAAEHGIPAIGVMWGHGDEAELLAAGAVGIAHTTADLTAVVTAALASNPAR